jgi:hypothetical protein
MKQEWGREGYAGDWPSDKAAWTIAAFFVALASVAAICAYRYERVLTPLHWHSTVADATTMRRNPALNAIVFIDGQFVFVSPEPNHRPVYQLCQLLRWHLIPLAKC